ncbi:hypothetical protein NL676_030515 [Syzygium grande]|nr:hypothetical protein NL676_030515 [Syzygium grande]
MLFKSSLGCTMSNHSLHFLFLFVFNDFCGSRGDFSPSCSPSECSGRQIATLSEALAARAMLMPAVDTQALAGSAPLAHPQPRQRLELGKDLKLPGKTTAEEGQITRKLVQISLWCIQNIPSDRPPISKVIEMLGRSHELFPMPPKPFPSSPVRQPSHSKHTSLSKFTDSNCKEEEVRILILVRRRKQNKGGIG